MRSLTEPAAGLRVLLRMPDLSSGAAKAKAAPEVVTFVQQPLPPLTPAPPAAPKILHIREMRGVTPEELQSPGSFKRSLAVLAVLAVAALVGITLSRRARQADAPSPVPETEIVAPEVKFVPGGTPMEITQSPEMRFPAAVPSPVSEADAMTIVRLPPVEDKPGTVQATTDAATTQVNDGASSMTSPQSIIARLQNRIEHSQPQVTR